MRVKNLKTIFSGESQVCLEPYNGPLMTDSKIERFEWDFDSCPADQLELCFEYERARSSAGQEEIKQAESWRSRGIKWASDEDRKAYQMGKVVSPLWFDQLEGSTFDDYWKQISADNYPMSAVHLYPEFPLTPYLTIPEAERDRRFALIKSAGIPPACAEDEELSNEFREKHGGEDRRWFEEGFSELCSEFDLSGDGVSHHGAEYQIEGNAIRCQWMKATFAVFRFDWNVSDQAFIDALRAWLDKNRDRTVKIRDARGGGSESRQFRSLLNKLGAWRLLNFPMTWKEAATHTQAVREDHKSLYSEQPAWIRARNEADRFLGMSNR